MVNSFQVSMSLGGEDKTELSLPEHPDNYVADGRWHRIHAQYDNKVPFIHPSISLFLICPWI